jgi:hypothetical protein
MPWLICTFDTLPSNSERRKSEPAAVTCLHLAPHRYSSNTATLIASSRLESYNDDDWHHLKCFMMLDCRAAPV